jgi:hypothetical protein
MYTPPDAKRITIPFDTPVPVSAHGREYLLNSYGNIRAFVDNGVVVIQTKKLKGDQREIIRIDTTHDPATITLSVEVGEGKDMSAP